MSIDFLGSQLLRRLEAEQKATAMETCKPVPALRPGDDVGEIWMKSFVDLYGFRCRNPKNPGVFLLSPWEFLMHWKCVRLPAPSEGSTCDGIPLSAWKEVSTGPLDCVPNRDAESTRLLFFPRIPGEMQLRSKWCMQKHIRPMVPAPSNTPLPDKAPDADGKGKLYSIYLRPWTLDRSAATDEVPYITDLDLVPIANVSAGSSDRLAEGTPGASHSDEIDPAAKAKKRRLRGKQRPADAPNRSVAMAWRTYIRGNVVTRHAARIITQFMAACCGSSTRQDGEDVQEQGDQTRADIPNNFLPLSRVHALLDHMSAAEVAEKKRKPRAKTLQEAIDQVDAEVDVDAEALRQSGVINNAMQLTARLWSRTAQPWPDDLLD